MPAQIRPEAVREIYQRLPFYFPHDSDHTRLLADIGRSESVGIYHEPTTPQTVLSYVTRHSLYNATLVVPNPFCDMMAYELERSPFSHPEAWRQVVFNQTLLLLVLRPWIEAGLIVCIPPLKWFDKDYFMESLLPISKSRVAEPRRTS